MLFYFHRILFILSRMLLCFTDFEVKNEVIPHEESLIVKTSMSQATLLEQIENLRIKIENLDLNIPDAVSESDDFSQKNDGE